MGSRAFGYSTEIDHLHAYSPELAPGLLGLAALNGGAATRVSRPLRYLELGCGQGLSLAIHAAACPGEYWGVDIDPAHVVTARAMADASGSRLHVLEGSFTDILARRDLPEFDVIVANRVWSRVSGPNRAAIVDIVRSKLADGGMLYLSYDCTPGWSTAVPLRHLMSLHADLAGTGGKGLLDRVGGALDFAQRVADTGMGYFKSNPGAVERLNAIRMQDRVRVARELFNADWSPMPFSQVAGMLAPAGVGFAVSGNLLHHQDGINLPPSSRQLLGEIDHPILRESVRDYLMDAQFRTDIFVKGGKPMPGSEQLARYLKQGFVLTRPAEDFRTHPGGSQVTIALDEAVIALKEEFHQPLIEALAERNYAPKTLRELSSHRRLKGRPLPPLITALVILTGAGILRPAQDAESTRQARPRCKALNACLIANPPAAGESGYLASPVTGAGVPVSRSDVLFLQAAQAGQADPEDSARFAWDNFHAEDVRAIPGPVAAREEKLAALTEEAKAFVARRRPILRALGVA